VFVDSGSQFLGLVLGYHSKASTNTMLNTGTVVGFSCIIFGAGFPERFIPSFTWGGTGDSQIYDVERSINTAQRLMSRRNITMTADDRRLFHKIFELTRQERGSVEIA